MVPVSLITVHLLATSAIPVPSLSRYVERSWIAAAISNVSVPSVAGGSAGYGSAPLAGERALWHDLGISSSGLKIEDSMRKPVRKVVFPVAGLGTRFLPATKAMPKEMLPVVDKPLIHYAVEEAKAAGIEQFFLSPVGRKVRSATISTAPSSSRPPCASAARTT